MIFASGHVDELVSCGQWVDQFETTIFSIVFLPLLAPLRCFCPSSKSAEAWLQVEYADGRDTLTFCDSHSDPGCHGVHAKRLKVPCERSNGDKPMFMVDWSVLEPICDHSWQETLGV